MSAAATPQPGTPREPEQTGQFTADIWTEQDRFGMWSYEFMILGKFYEDHDYQSRANALEAARSHFRQVVAFIEQPAESDVSP